MADAAGALHVQQLVELLAVVSSFADQQSAVRGAAERAAQALEAEVAVVILAGRVAAAVGFPAERIPEAELLDVAELRRDVLTVPGSGPCPTVTASWGGSHPGHLVLARSDGAFSIEETNLVRGMARLLELTLRMLRTLATEHAMRERSERQAAENAGLLVSLRQRQRLLEELFEIQRAISRRAPLPQILQTVVAATHSLLGGDVIALWSRDDGADGTVRLASSTGLDPDAAKRLPPVRLAEAGIAGPVLARDALIVRQGERRTASVLDQLAGRPLYATMAAPVHESGVVTGCLVVASYQPGHRFEPAQEQTLLALAEHVSLALTDAHTLGRMHEAFHDSLTGLASRALFLDGLATRLAAASRDGSATALLFVDLDRFKAVNDTLGHAAGDQLLVATADRLRAQLRVGDLAARLGGDEFAVMLPAAAGSDGAAALAGRIVAALGEPVLVAGQWLRIGASIGSAVAGPGELDAAELVRRADVAMYEAKRGGRGRHATYTAELQDAFAAELAG